MYSKSQPRPSQEQSQIMAIAIGMPTTKAPTITNVNSESRFIPGRAFPTMLVSPQLTWS
jgi:hypothetical protein